MVKCDLDDARAFVVLQRLSSHENRKLFHVAQAAAPSRGLPRRAQWWRGGAASTTGPFNLDQMLAASAAP